LAMGEGAFPQIRAKNLRAGCVLMVLQP
jgi:hypothetical protein